MVKLYLTLTVRWGHSGADSAHNETRRRMGAPVLNDEVVRVVKSAPKWKAAKYDGNPIRLTGNVRIVFTGE